MSDQSTGCSVCENGRCTFRCEADPDQMAARQEGYTEAVEHAANLLDLSRQEIRLGVGELSDNEIRAVLAVLAWRQRKIRELANAR